MAIAQSSTESRISQLKAENARLKAALAALTGDGDAAAATDIASMSVDAKIKAFGAEKALELINRERESNQ